MTREELAKEVMIQTLKSSDIKKLLLLADYNVDWIKLGELNCGESISRKYEAKISIYYDIDLGELVFQEEDEDGASILYDIEKSYILETKTP